MRVDVVVELIMHWREQAILEGVRLILTAPALVVPERAAQLIKAVTVLHRAAVAVAAVQVELVNLVPAMVMAVLVWQAQLPDLQFITEEVAVVLVTVLLQELAAMVVVALELLIQLTDILGLMVWAAAAAALVQTVLRLAAVVMAVRVW